MTHTRSIVTVIVLLIVLIIVIAIAGKRAEAPVVTQPNATSTPIEPGIPADNAGVGVAVTDSFENGAHTYAFDLYLPTPCHRLSEPDVIIRESFPEQIVIAYTILPPAPDVMCAQVISRVPVSVKAIASENATLTSITLNGNPVAFRIVAD